MAVKIKMLRERIIPILYETGEPGKVYKVNNDVAKKLVEGGDAEYMDPDMKAKAEEEEKRPKKKPEPETAMAKPEEDAMMPREKPRKYGRRK